MGNTLNFFIFLFYIITAFSIWRLLVSYSKSARVYKIVIWSFWLLAIIFHGTSDSMCQDCVDFAQLVNI